jgi:hypothetical protein
MKTQRKILVAAMLAVQAGAVAACGHCVEDRVAATYDFALVSRALDQRHEVAFFAIQGPLLADRITAQALTRLLGGIQGIDRGSLRVSLATESLSFAYDPARTPLQLLQRRFEDKLGTKGLSLGLLRVLDPASYVKPPAIAAR